MEAAIRKLETASATSQVLSPQQAEFSKQFAIIPVLSVSELVEKDKSPALYSVDKEGLAFCIALAIGKYLRFIGCEMTEEQTLETAQMMIEIHPNITIAAIKSFFYECKRGSYGYHYNKMDGSKLLMWFDKFVEDYYKQIDDYEYAKHMSTKGDLANPANLTDEEVSLSTWMSYSHRSTAKQKSSCSERDKSRRYG
jgi:hypothetical protein